MLTKNLVIMTLKKLISNYKLIVASIIIFIIAFFIGRSTAPSKVIETKISVIENLNENQLTTTNIKDLEKVIEEITTNFSDGKIITEKRTILRKSKSESIKKKEIVSNKQSIKKVKITINKKNDSLNLIYLSPYKNIDFQDIKNYGIMYQKEILDYKLGIGANLSGTILLSIGKKF